MSANKIKLTHLVAAVTIGGLVQPVQAGQFEKDLARELDRAHSRCVGPNYAGCMWSKSRVTSSKGIAAILAGAAAAAEHDRQSAMNAMRKTIRDLRNAR